MEAPGGREDRACECHFEREKKGRAVDQESGRRNAGGAVGPSSKSVGEKGCSEKRGYSL